MATTIPYRSVYLFYIWLLFLLEKYSKICPCDLDLANVKYSILK